MTVTDKTDLAADINPDVLYILKRAEASRAVFEIFVGEAGHRGRTKIVACRDGRIHFRGIEPRELQARLAPGGAVRFSFNLRNGRYAFAGRISELEESASGGFFMPVPQKIDRTQLRKSPRLEPTPDMPVRVIALGKFSAVEQIGVNDVSASGVSLSMPLRAETFFHEKNLSFRLDLGRFGSMTIEGTILSIAWIVEDVYRLSVRFVRTQPHERRNLENYLEARRKADAAKDGAKQLAKKIEYNQP